ncbi:MAG: 2Fe-2S iron-sulfur cluster binding domain-containing protein [Alphaproteobacteria bacterium]|nr:2Fe-2S iron-sulfur cluster binding domain-containing protein [Alphaproteobacteria bacterium]
MPSAFHSLTIDDVRHETPDSISVRFAVPDALAARFTFKAGQHLTLRAAIAGAELRRNYSVCVASGAGEMRIAIKRIAGGAFSSWALETLRPGMALDVMPPHGTFTLEPDPARAGRYLGIAGGSGITPIKSVIETVLTAEPLSRFTLFYGNRDSRSILFLEDLAALKNRFMGRFALYHFLEAEIDEEAPLFNGRLDGEKLTEALALAGNPQTLDRVFLCGPPAMMAAAERALEAAGVPPARVLAERFLADRPDAASLHRQAEARRAAEGRPLVLRIDGRQRRLAYDGAKGSILENAQAAGIPAPFACKSGVCATCRAKLVSGSVTMAVQHGLTADSVAQGYILTCQAVPASDDVVLDYDA